MVTFPAGNKLLQDAKALRARQTLELLKRVNTDLHKFSCSVAAIASLVTADDSYFQSDLECLSELCASQKAMKAGDAQVLPMYLPTPQPESLVSAMQPWKALIWAATADMLRPLLSPRLNTERLSDWKRSSTAALQNLELAYDATHKATAILDKDAAYVNICRGQNMLKWFASVEALFMGESYSLAERKAMATFGTTIGVVFNTVVLLVRILFCEHNYHSLLRGVAEISE